MGLRSYIERMLYNIMQKKNGGQKKKGKKKKTRKSINNVGTIHIKSE